MIYSAATAKNMLNLFEAEVRKEPGEVGSTLVLHDKNLNKAFPFLVTDGVAAEGIASTAEQIASAVKNAYSPERQEQAKDIVKEFLDATPEWLAQMEKAGITNHCPGCGLKPSKLKELTEALKLLTRP